ncbi:MAG TPA: type III PLP-dependent enzyme, partial [Vitreimonas sp.]|nr:type III PLP-dependent enzyme [Vitreimonas sp.]
MDSVLSPLDLAARGAPEGPVAIARPHRVGAAALWFKQHFPGEVFYAVKANPSPWVLDALVANGVTNFDVASETETQLIASRYPQARIAFMHPVKSRRAIGRAFYEFGVKTFALDSEDELEKILQETNRAKDLTLVVRFAVSGDGAAYPLARKFGTTPEDAPALLRRARGASEEMLGVSFHVGSQCMRPDSFRAAMDMVNRAIVNAGVLVDVVDIGGGFPAIYPGMNPPPMIDYVKAIKAGFEEMFVAQNATLWAEPGRALVAEAGSTVARVELRKGDALYLNDGAFGTLFDATHLNWSFPAKLLRDEPSRAKDAPFRLYGPTCDSMDAAAGPFMLPADIREGDL